MNHPRGLDGPRIRPTPHAPPSCVQADIRGTPHAAGPPEPSSGRTSHRKAIRLASPRSSNRNPPGPPQPPSRDPCAVYSDPSCRPPPRRSGRGERADNPKTARPPSRPACAFTMCPPLARSPGETKALPDLAARGPLMGPGRCRGTMKTNHPLRKTRSGTLPMNGQGSEKGSAPKSAPNVMRR
jgi:hypothetical protein